MKKKKIEELESFLKLNITKGSNNDLKNIVNRKFGGECKISKKKPK